MFKDIVEEMLTAESQYMGITNDTIGTYSIPGKERNLINEYNPRLVKSLRKEIKAAGLISKSIIKHFGGISGYIEQEGKMARDWIYFVWDITNPETISFRFNCYVQHINTESLVKDLTDFRHRLGHKFQD